MPRITLLPLLLTLSGCALVFQGANEQVTVNTLSNKDINDTSCTLANEEGRWDVKGNDLVVIHRDGNAMTITCANQRQSGSAVVEGNICSSPACCASRMPRRTVSTIIRSRST